MKNFSKLILGFALLLCSITAEAQTNKKAVAKSTVSSKVEVYYFHYTRRCNTCKSVEENAKLALQSLYTDKVKTGEYTFKGINLDDANSKAIAEKLEIGGQTLLVVSGNKKVDITDKGFLNANDLEKMKTIIRSAIDDVKMN
jgi:hypothetical protein